jgi:hypothetical protein
LFGGGSVAEPIEELRGLSTEEIIRRHDEQAIHTFVGTQHYLDELARRDAEEQGRRMEALTESMNRLIRVGVGVGIVGAIIAAVTLIMAAVTAFSG